MLTVTHLSAGYGKLTVLHEIDLTIPAGQFTAILGPNGSGKSTLLKTIFGLTDRMGGDIRLQNELLTELPTEQVSRQGIAYIPQRQNVFASMSVRENLLLALRHLDGAQVEQAITEATALFPILGQRAGPARGQAQRRRTADVGHCYWLAFPSPPYAAG